MKHNEKTILMLVSIVVLLAAMVGTTIAYLVADTQPITNTFTPTSVPVHVDEKTNDGVKSNVKIQNKGNTEAYIRAMVVITWKDDEGNIYAEQPKQDTDYTISWTKDYWQKYDVDGFYYYTKPVASQDYTGELFTNCQPVANQVPDGYNLSVEIIAQSIQAVPDDAIKQAWGVTISNGNVTAVSKSN